MRKSKPLAQILTGRLIRLAIIVLLINSFAIAIFYGSDQAGLEDQAIDWELSKLEQAFDHDQLNIDDQAKGLFRDHPESYAYALVDPEGLIKEAENAELIPPQALTEAQFAQDWKTRLQIDDQVVIVASHRLQDDGMAYRIIFAQRQDGANLARRALIAEFASHVGVPILPLALLLIGANSMMVRRDLRPVATAAQWARDLKPGQSLAPLDTSHLPAEIEDLVAASRRSLERLNQALETEKRQAAEIAHALRTPVAVLMARLDGVPSSPATDQMRHDVATLARTVQQVLASAKADSVQIRPQARLNLGEVTQKVIAQLGPLAYQQGAELHFLDASEPVYVLGDEDAAELALTNLIENAITHGGRGAVEVEVKRDGSVSVSDQGPGLSDEQQQRLFEPFWRAETAPEGGSGLGLAIVKRLQEAQNGRVTVRSTPGSGAVFTLIYRLI